MAKSEIVITQSSVSGAPSVARRGLANSTVLTFSNSTDGDVGVHTWQWTLIEAPPGSSASLVGPTGATCTLTPDIEGRYVVSLRVNGLGDDTDGYSVTIAGVSFTSLGTLVSGDNLGDWDLPAYYERDFANWTDQFGPLNPRGAQREVWRMFEQIRRYVLPGVIPGGANPERVIPIRLTSALQSLTDVPAATNWATAAYLPLLDFANISGYSEARIRFTHARIGTAGTAQVRLYDITNGAAVTGTALTTTSANPVDSLSAAITVGSSSGNLRNDGDTRYALQHEITGGVAGTDYSAIYAAELVLRV